MQRQPLGLPQRGHRLVEPAFLRERDAGQRVHQREVAPIAGGVQRRGGLRDVLADDGHVADLPVAEPELVVGEADGARVVRALRLLQRLGEERDAARRLAARDGQAAVQPPELREPGRVQPLAPLRRTAQRLGRLPHVVLQQPRFGERAANLDLLVAAAAPGCLQRANQQGGRLGAVPAFERLDRLRVKVRVATRRSIPCIQTLDMIFGSELPASPLRALTEEDGSAGTEQLQRMPQRIGRRSDRSRIL